MGRTARIDMHAHRLEVYIFPAESLDVMLVLQKPHFGTSGGLVFSSGDVTWLGLNLRMLRADRSYHNMRTNSAGRLNVGVKWGDVHGWIQVRDNTGQKFHITEEQADYVARKIERGLAHGRWREPPPLEKRR